MTLKKIKVYDQKKNCLFSCLKTKMVLLLKKKSYVKSLCNLVNIRLLKLKEDCLKIVGVDSIFNEIVFFCVFAPSMNNL